MKNIGRSRTIRQFLDAIMILTTEVRARKIMIVIHTDDEFKSFQFGHTRGLDYLHDITVISQHYIGTGKVMMTDPGGDVPVSQ